MTYIVYFEIFGKKMKTTVMTDSKRNAEKKVRDNLKIVKIEVEPPEPRHKTVTDLFNDILNILK